MAWRLWMGSLFVILIIFILLQGLAGVIDSIRYYRYIQAHLKGQPETWTPYTSVILPCKGLDHELGQNVAALLTQNYPDYEVIFVTASSEDLSLPLLHSLAAKFPQRKTTFVTAGVSDQRGEKVNNLIRAIARSNPRSEVFVFSDSDSRPRSSWLTDLISPLQNEAVGASTGYRWFFPARGNFASVLRSAWNGSIATLLGDHDHNFAWGGSMAIRRSTFERTKVLAHWRNSISDDYSLTRAVKEAKLKIHYEPRCLVPSHGDCGWRELLRWSTRQMLITKVYSRRLWQLAFASQLSFVIGWWWAIARLTVAAWQALTYGDNPTPLWFDRWPHLVSIIVLIYLLGTLRGVLRLQTLKLIFFGQWSDIRRFWWGYTLLAPLVSSLMTYNLIASMLTSTLEWRGMRYQLISANEVRVIRQ